MGDGVIQTSFTSGEIAPSLYGRVDFNRYYTGLKTCRNFIVRQFGGVTNRTGSRYISPQNDESKRARLIPFVYSQSQSYVLEFGHLYMRIIKDGVILVNAAGTEIVIDTPYTSSDLRTESDIDLLKYAQSFDVLTLVQQNYTPHRVMRNSATDWTLSFIDTQGGPFGEINTDASSMLSVTSGSVTGTVTLKCVAPIFKSGHVDSLMYIEQNPEVQIPRWEVGKLISVGNQRRAGANVYECTVGGTTGTVRPTTLEGTESDGIVVWRYLHSGFGLVRIIKYVDPFNVTAYIIKRLPDSLYAATSSDDITNVTWSAATDTDHIKPTFTTTTAHGMSVGTYVTIAGYAGIASGMTSTGKRYLTNLGYEVKAAQSVLGVKVSAVPTSNSFTIDIAALGRPLANGGVISNLPIYNGSFGNISHPVAASATYKWAFGAWNDTDLYPGAVGYFQQRQVFAGSIGKPQTSWFSRIGGFTDFSSNIPVLDDDAITATLNSRRLNEIRHFVELTDMIMLTSDGPFIIKGDQNGTITPSTINFKRQGVSGCSQLTPITVGNTALYVQELGSQVKNIGYSFQQDAFVGNDLSVISNHLFLNHSIVDWTYQQIPFSTIWAVREDGTLLGLTYMPEQEVIGWHRHDTDGEYESVCCITEGGKDVVYCTVSRVIDGTKRRFIEKFEDRFPSDVRFNFFVDSGLTYDGRNIGTTTNLFLNSAVPATQTVTLPVGVYTCWVTGAGTMTSVAGTAVGSGFGAATGGTDKTITITTAGTVVFTKAGTVTHIQLEYGSAKHSDPIITTAAAVTVDNTMTLSGGTHYDYQETLTLTSSADDMFAATDIGNIIQYIISDTEVLRLTITQYTNPKVVSVVPEITVPVAYRSARTDWEFAKTVMSGLDHLEGKTVAVVCDGYEHPTRVVTGGEIELDEPAAIVHVGLPIEADFETLDIAVSNQNVKDKHKIIPHVSMFLEESVGLFAGSDADHLVEYKARSIENYSERVTPVSGMIDIRIPATWTKGGRVFVRQSKPFPLTILAVVPEVTLGGT